MTIKKLFTVFAAAAALFASSKALAAEPCELRFAQEQGGKYIYCNNIESITSNDLADRSCETARYIMNNEGLTPGRYVFFGAFINRTNTVSGGAPSERNGFDIDVDAVFKALEDTELTISKLGFEVPEHSVFFLDGQRYSGENEWGGFCAWASYFNVPIKQLNSGNVFEPDGFEPVTVKLKAGETLWLSQLTDDYRSVPLARSVHIVFDLEITSGSCDLDVAALRSTGTPGDRSNFKADAEFGRYRRDRQYKGISDGLNEVSADLHYTVDDSDPDGMKLPVTVYNQFVPEGKTIDKWYTHLNPRADEWSNDICAESDMLRFIYHDPSKKLLYGPSVAEGERNDTYIFDTSHTDLAVYDKSYGSYASYVPNRELTEKDGTAYACNLGNYGVIYNYNVEIENKGNKTRYLIYKLATSSNNLVWVKNENGRILNDRILAKGRNESRVSDAMVCVPVSAQTTAEYTVCVLLAANYSGGMENSFELSDYRIPIETYESLRGGIEKDSSFDGREYYRWQNGELNLSDDGESWRPVALPKSVLDGIKGNLAEYRLVWTGAGYTLRPTLYDAGWFAFVDHMYRSMYLLNENFELIRTRTFGSYPSDYSCANGIHYVMLSGTAFRSDTDFKWWDITNMEMPCWNYGTFSAVCDLGDISLSTDGKAFHRVRYLDYKPQYIDSYDGYYYSTDGRVLSLSPDGLYWRHMVFNERVRSYRIIGGDVVVNGSERRPLPEFNDTVAVMLDGEYISQATEALLINNSPYIPLRAIGELLGYKVIWNDGEVILSKDGEDISISGITVIGDRAYAPLNILVYNLDMDVKYDGIKKIAEINS